jgi:two-component system, NarL family, response regulator LiaR
MNYTCSEVVKVLIVEDDPIVNLGLKKFLETKSRFQVLGIAEDGLQGIKLAASLNPDLVIMDVGLPYLDGIAATQRIKEEISDVRVLMLTSHRSEIEVIAAFSSGADAYCIKGMNFDSFLNAIYSVCDGATYLDAQIAHILLENLKPPVNTDNQLLGQLSQRELEVLKLIVEGFSNVEIGNKLYISVNTVKNHVRHILNKLVVDDRVQAAVIALRMGLV